MAKAGMKRPEIKDEEQKNETNPVPEIQGKAKCGNKKAKPM